MEITNEIKAKVFAQYLGQYVQCDSEYHGKKELNERSLFGLPPCKLILKPLSAITDEDAKEAIEIWGEAPYPLGAITVNSRPSKWSRVIIERSKELPHFVFQCLQSKGYDLPNYLLDGKTLQECGLAIYE